MVTKCLKMCSMSLTTMEMLTKITLRFHLTIVKLVTIGEIDSIDTAEDLANKKTLCIVGGQCEVVQPLQKRV